MEDPMECQICYIPYTITDRRPMMLCLNQHIVCEQCLKVINPPACPFCKLIFSPEEIRPFRILMDKLNQKQVIIPKPKEMIMEESDVAQSMSLLRYIKPQKIFKCNCNLRCPECRCPQCPEFSECPRCYTNCSIWQCIKWLFKSMEFYIILLLIPLMTWVIMMIQLNFSKTLFISLYVWFAQLFIFTCILIKCDDNLVWRLGQLRQKCIQGN